MVERKLILSLSRPAHGSNFPSATWRSFVEVSWKWNIEIAEANLWLWPCHFQTIIYRPKLELVDGPSIINHHRSLCWFCPICCPVRINLLLFFYPWLGASAARGGADRVELCANLGAGGGTTPSLGLLKAVQQAVNGLPVMVCESFENCTWSN